MQQTISQFRGEFGFLSNFYQVPVEYEGKTYPSVEHAFQAAKTLNDAERESVRRAATSSEAKRLGRRLTLRPDWEDVKDQVMLTVLRAKFTDYDLACLLVGTGEAHLVEGNTWGDRYWGVCQGQGLNRLGELLMQVRAELDES